MPSGVVAVGGKMKSCWGIFGDGQRNGAGSTRKTQPFNYHRSENRGADVAGAGKRRKKYHYRHRDDTGAGATGGMRR